MKVQKRNTTQFLLPENTTPTSSGKYNIYPGLTVPENSIQKGYKTLAARIETMGTVIMDGYVGVFWEDLRNGLNQEFRQKDVRVLWHSVDTALKTSDDIAMLVKPYLGGDDPIFGKRTDLKLQDFFQDEHLQTLKADDKADINIVYGTGAELCGWNAPVIYVDVPKNELQFRMRAGAISNLGAEKPTHTKMMYKQFYFVDWVVLNHHKKSLVTVIDVIVDDQRPKNPFWTTGDCMRDSLKKMSENFFRVRPWFEPGVWGGTWMKDNIKQLSTDVPNYAWSFELIAPENGLILQDNGKMLEFSFDFLMFQEYKNVLGEAADSFKYEFPIRFDYLDTFDGGNLSIQVHPQQDYIVAEFGENFTQDECYYMLDVKDGAEVYLGFQEHIDPNKFCEELQLSATETVEVDIKNHVQALKAKKHDLFLIPAGTIHGSGKNNLVLEISATPYIFTFKLYDWLRLDLEGQPRPLNLERGFKNLDFNRKGDVIRKEFVSHPKVLVQGLDWNLFHLETHPDHFYDVYRYEFDTTIGIQTDSRCHVLALVEGTSIILETQRGMRQRFNFGETFVVPAACGTYTLNNESGYRCKVIKAFVKSKKMKP